MNWIIFKTEDGLGGANLFGFHHIKPIIIKILFSLQNTSFIDPKKDNLA